MKSLFKSAFVAGVAIGAMVSTTAVAQTVRMGTEGAYPPYNFINDSGDVDGFEREVGDELCKRANLTCEWVVNEWDPIIPNWYPATTTRLLPTCRLQKSATSD